MIMEDAFKLYALSNAKRPLIYDNSGSRPLFYLSQYVFLPYFRDNENNVIAGEYLKCDDCRNKWVKDHKEIWSRFYESDFTKQKTNLCWDGSKVEDNFKNC